MTFLVTRLAEVVTESSARNGEAEYQETVYADQEMGIRDTVDELRDMAITSSYPIRSTDDCRGTWTTTHEEIDYVTGESRTESLHIRKSDGSALSGRQLFRLYRAANLVEHFND